MSTTPSPERPGTATAATPPRVADTTVDHRDDIAAIEGVIADVETAFNTNDPELMVEHWADNGTAVNVFGMPVVGRVAMLENSRQGLSGPLRDQHARYEIADVTFVRPDVAVVHKKAWATTPEGERLAIEHAMLAQYVLVKEPGRWWIVARQNTLLPTDDGN